MTEWLAFDTLEPPATFQSNYMAALICSVIANFAQAFAGGKEGRKAFTPSDFLPDWAGDRRLKTEEQGPAQSVEDMKRAFQHIASASKKKEKGPSTSVTPMKKRKAKVDGK